MSRATTSHSPRLLVAAFALLLVSLLALPGSARSAFPGTNGKIAFQSDRDGPFEIYTMNADGTGQTNISNNAAVDIAPAWSPDGTKIAFVSDRDGSRAIFTMNADGSNPTNLTGTATFDNSPAWSPDGTKIAFDRGGIGAYEIYTMNADGTGQTNISNNPGSDIQPVWSPDGTKIAFASDRDGGGNIEVYTMNANGTGQANISNNPATIDYQPDWSPDGTKIAFASDRDGNLEVYTMNADGTGQTNISNNAASEAQPVWSPDGTKIAFYSDRDGNLEVYTMNAGGTGQTNISNNAADDFAPGWGPLPQVGPPPLDHFKTYETDLGKPKFSKRTVTLADAFGSSQVSVSEQRWLANPVDKNGEGVNSRDDRLKCYSISDKKKFKEQKIAIDNQFGAGQKLSVESPKRLCVPASKGLANQTPPAPPTGLDHYKCYEAEGKKLNRTVTLVDEFVAGDQVTVVDVEYLCNPAVKNNEGPLVRPDDLLVCYELSKLDKFTARKVSLRDQFGSQTLEVKKPEKLCVPSTLPTGLPSQ